MILPSSYSPTSFQIKDDYSVIFADLTESEVMKII